VPSELIDHCWEGFLDSSFRDIPPAAQALSHRGREDGDRRMSAEPHLLQDAE